MRENCSGTSLARESRSQPEEDAHGRTNDIVARASVWECQPEG